MGESSQETSQGTKERLLLSERVRELNQKNSAAPISLTVALAQFKPGECLDPGLYKETLNEPHTREYLFRMINSIVTKYGNFSLNNGSYPSGAPQLAILSALQNLVILAEGD